MNKPSISQICVKFMDAFLRYKIFEWIDHRTGLGVYEQISEKLGDKGNARFDQRLVYLRDQPPQNWRDPHAKKLSWEYDNDCKNIIEIRFEANNLQQRPMGFFGPDPSSFIIYVWTTKKGTQYKPSNFCQIAKSRRDELEDGNGRLREIEVG